MKLAVVFETNSSQAEKIATACTDLGYECDCIDIGSIALEVEAGVPDIIRAAEHFKGYDSVFLQASERLLLFVEPFLEELSERGISCQLKPTAFNTIANKPFMFATLNAKGVPTPRMSILSYNTPVESAAKRFNYPILMEAYNGFERVQSIIIESDLTLKSFLKSLPNYRMLSMKEYHIGDLEESIVIGDEVHTIRRSWNPEKLAHTEKPFMVKLAEEKNAMIVDAARILGVDIATVRTSGSYVIDISTLVDLDRFSHVLGTDLSARIVTFYAGKGDQQ